MFTAAGDECTGLEAGNQAEPLQHPSAQVPARDTHRHSQATCVHTPLYKQVTRSQGSRAPEAGKVPGASHSYSRLCTSRQRPYEVG